MTVTTGVITTARKKTGEQHPQQVADCAKNYTLVRVIYREYNTDTGDNGVAILVLSEPVDFRANARRVCKLCLSQKTPAVGDTCIVSGWGREALGESRLERSNMRRETIQTEHKVIR